ncbi:hypothetical protein SH2C18_45520 [Clostridium sediminicola]
MSIIEQRKREAYEYQRIIKNNTEPMLEKLKPYLIKIRNYLINLRLVMINNVIKSFINMRI